MIELKKTEGWGRAVFTDPSRGGIVGGEHGERAHLEALSALSYVTDAKKSENGNKLLPFFLILTHIYVVFYIFAQDALWRRHGARSTDDGKTAGLTAGQTDGRHVDLPAVRSQIHVLVAHFIRFFLEEI